MNDWNLTQSISRGIENGLSKMGDKITDGITKVLVGAGNVVLDAGATFVIVILIYTVIKYMVTTKKEKQEENFNMLISMGGLYFIIRMLGVILSM